MAASERRRPAGVGRPSEFQELPRTSLPRGNIFLFLLQDASVRLWDIRTDSTRSAIPPPTVVSGGNDPIRLKNSCALATTRNRALRFAFA